MTFAQRSYSAVQRNPGMTIGFVLGFTLILVVGLRGENTRNIVTDSPCAKEASAECQNIKQRSDEERSVSSTCVLFYKVDKGGKLLKLTKCEVKQPRGGGGAIEPGRVAPVGAEAASGRPDRGRGDSTSTVVPPKGGGKPPSAPASGGTNGEPSRGDPAPAAASPGKSEGHGNSESSKANPIAEGAGKAVEDVGSAAGDVVGETGDSVNHAVEGVTGKACGPLGASCGPAG